MKTRSHCSPSPSPPAMAGTITVDEIVGRANRTAYQGRDARQGIHGITTPRPPAYPRFTILRLDLNRQIRRRPPLSGDQKMCVFRAPL